MPKKTKPDKSPLFLQRLAQEKSEKVAASRAKYAHVRVSLPENIESPETDLLTRKLVEKRGVAGVRSKPTHYTSQTRSVERNTEQSLKNAPVRDLRHANSPRTLLLDQRRQHKVYNADEKFSAYIAYEPEKTYQVKPRKMGNALLVCRSGVWRERM